MRMQRVAYVAHSLGEPDVQEANIEHAALWVRFIVDNTRWAVIAPWVNYRTMLGVDYRPRALVDCVTIIQRCVDVLVLVGPTISPHMEYEIAEAKRRNIPVIDLTHLGDEMLGRTDLRDAIERLVKEKLHG